MVDGTRIGRSVKQDSFIFVIVENRACAEQGIRCGSMQPSRFCAVPPGTLFSGLARV
jgi:hypothetical protein